MSLWALGITLLGVVLGATLLRWNYQAQQERALLLERGPAAAVSEQRFAAAGKDVPVQFGPPAPSSRAAAEAESPAEGGTHSELAPTENVAKPAARRVKGERHSIAIDPSAVGLIEIPGVGLQAVISEGADEGTLMRAVGRVPGSARPGEIGNMVLAGHRDTFFRPLRKIRLNDRIRVIVPPNTYEYRVQSLRVVEPQETGVLDSKGVEELTLVTCYPFRFIGPAPERFIVSAARVN